MFRKKEPLETITITFDPPPDGTYPPRILSPGWTTWLNKDEIPLQHGAVIRRRESTFTLYQHECKKDILVNGNAIMELHILKDGDHIRIGNWVAIYQYDPVADYKKPILPDEQTINIELSRVLKKWVIADSQGLSFDGGKNVAKWGDIVSIEVAVEWRWRVNNNFTIVVDNPKRTKLPTRLKNVRSTNFAPLLEVLFYTAPFAVSVDLLRVDPYAREQLDAFTHVAVQKIFQPMNKNQKELFVTSDYLLGLPDRKNAIRNVVLVLFLSPFALTSISFIEDTFTVTRFIERYIGSFIIWFLFALVILVGRLLPFILRYIRGK